MKIWNEDELGHSLKLHWFADFLIVTSSVTFIKSANQCSFKLCLIVHLVAVWTLIYEDELVIGDCWCILGKLNGSSHWSNIEVWRRCAHNHGYWNVLFQPSRRNTAGGKIATRVLASTASDGLTFNADILQQQHHIDKHFYLWNVILLAPLP